LLADADNATSRRNIQAGPYIEMASIAESERDKQITAGLLVRI